MEEPYETLLGQYKDHPVMGQYLQHDLPEWDNLYHHAMPMISSGERIMVQAALCLYNAYGSILLRDIFLVDQKNQERILAALSHKILDYDKDN